MGRGLLPRSDASRHRTDHHCSWEAEPGHQRVRKQADQATEQLRAIPLEDGEERLLALSHADSAAMPGEREHVGSSWPSRRTAYGRWLECVVPQRSAAPAAKRAWSGNVRTAETGR